MSFYAKLPLSGYTPSITDLTPRVKEKLRFSQTQTRVKCLNLITVTELESEDSQETEGSHRTRDWRMDSQSQQPMPWAQPARDWAACSRGGGGCSYSSGGGEASGWELSVGAHTGRNIWGRASKRIQSRTSLVVKWLRIHLALQGTWVQSLVGELRSHMPQSNYTHYSQINKKNSIPPKYRAADRKKCKDVVAEVANYSIIYFLLFFF